MALFSEGSEDEEMKQVAAEAALTFSNCFIGSLTQDGLVTVQHWENVFFLRSNAIIHPNSKYSSFYAANFSDLICPFDDYGLTFRR